MRTTSAIAAEAARQLSTRIIRLVRMHPLAETG